MLTPPTTKREAATQPEPPRQHGTQTLPNLKSVGRSTEPAVRAVAGRTHRGKVRERNDDHFLVVDVNRSLAVRCSSLEPAPRLAPSQGTILIVADGMGGYGQGELASAVAVDELVSYLSSSMLWAASHHGRDEALREAFQEAAVAAQERIQRVAAERSADPRMGTTLTVVYVLGGELFVAHVGDSRAYLHRPGYGLCRLTSDHTLGELLEQQGFDGSARQNVLTQAVGGSDSPPRIDARRDRLVTGDRLLLCTDGVSGFVSDERLAELCGASAQVDSIADSIVHEVLGTDAKDNLTVVVAEVK